MKKALNCFLLSGLLAVAASCGNYNYNNAYITPGTSLNTNFPMKAYVSNPVQPNALGGGSPVLDVLDASQDLLSTFTVSLASLVNNVNDAGMMAMSPSRDRTIVYSPSDTKLAIVNNASQSVSSAVTLGGTTESFFVWNDNVTLFAATPNATSPGLTPGALVRIDLPTAKITATIPIPGAHFVVPSPDGKVLLVFSDNSNFVTMVTPALIGANGQSNNLVACSSTQLAVCVLAGSFDRPVGAVFNSGTAYVLNCGQQCGGAGAGACLTFTVCTTVAAVDMTQTPPAISASVAVPAATNGVIQSNALFVAGTPSNAADSSCSGTKTAAGSCGRLTPIDLGSFTAATPLTITDGYHTRLVPTPNGQLFIGSRNCTNVNIANGEVRGCLTILNSTSGSVAASNLVFPPDNGDVTGIQPIPNRNVVYLCEGGHLRIYDTTTDKLAVLAGTPTISGQAIDVKVVF